MLRFSGPYGQALPFQKGRCSCTRTLFRIFCIIFLISCLLLSAASAEETPLIRAGGSFGFALSADGTIWGWGDNGRGQLGTGDTKRVRTPQPVAVGIDGNQIQDIQCGNVSTLFLMKDGTVFSCGNNNYGQQGQGKGAPSALTEARQVMGLQDIQQVACGFGQCLALNSQGQVYAWGRNDYGQLGIGSRKSQDTPVLLDLKDISFVACGGKFSMAMDKNGDIYGWGDNEHGQLLDAGKGKVQNPVRLSISGRFVTIACGGDHALGLDADGRLWSWGRNDYLQLGTKTKKKAVAEPVELTLPEGYEDTVFTAIYAYNSHTAAVSAVGGLWIWGSVYHGQIGNGVTASKSLPIEPCPASQVVASAVGSLQSYVLLEDGSLYGAGCNEYSQTGAFKRRTDYYVREWKAIGLNLLTGTWTDPGND